MFEPTASRRARVLRLADTLRVPRSAKFDDSVFLNVPFDQRYQKIFDALVFAVRDCGFVARCALESEDSSVVRVQKIFDLIRECRHGIHDISRAGIDRGSRLARFNMPLELGIFLGAKNYGGAAHASKRCLVLDSEKYRYQIFCSDISGQDIRSHQNDPDAAISAVRNWLSSFRKGVTIPSGSRIQERYSVFRKQLPRQAKAVNQNHRELTFSDYSVLVVGWLQENPW
jgi:hypothetical protein